MKKSTKVLLGLIMGFFPIVLAALWSLYPSIPTLIAIQTLPTLKIDLEQEVDEAELRQGIQRHFSSKRVHLPLENVNIKSREKSPLQNRFNSIMMEACGTSFVSIWIPFKIRLPFYGYEVFEWCWKPKLSLRKS